MLIYQPDTLAQAQGVGVLQAENQLLYEMARFNFSNFLVRNFDLETEHLEGYNRMLFRGFLNFDEAQQYVRQLSAAPELKDMLRSCRSVVVSEQNMPKLGQRYSYADYDEFYERTFMPLPISDEDLLQIPEYIDQPEEEDELPEGEEDAEETPQGNADDFDFDDLF